MPAHEDHPKKPPKLPHGPLIIQNVAYPNRVADLYGGELNGPLIGYHYQNGPNQKWVFEPQDNIGLKYKIYTVANQSGDVHAYASNSPNPVPNEVLYGTIKSTAYTVRRVEEGYYTITVDGAGFVLYWTLHSDKEGTKILLEKKSNNHGQRWFLHQA